MIVNDALEVNLTEKQLELYNAFCDPSIDEILFWWWGRWWKTWWVCEIINITCIQYPWIVRLVWREERTDLRATSVNTLLKTFKGHRMWRKNHRNINWQTKTLTYYNWSKIIFVPLKLQPWDPEFDFLWSYEATHARIDEAQQVERKAIDVLKSRLTEKVAEYGIAPKLIATCNPDKWHLYSDFIKPEKEGKLKKGRCFIQSLYSDNPYIDHERYRKQFENADKVTKARILEGNREYDNSPGRLFDYDKICDLETNAKIVGQKYISCDVARLGKDKAIIRVWDWLVEIERVTFLKSTVTQLISKIKELSQRHIVPMSNTIVDEDWVGGWVVDWLKCKGFVNWSSPIDTRTDAEIRQWKPKPNYWSLKDQCYFELAKHVNSGKIKLLKLTDDLKQELDNIVQIDIDKDRPLRVIKKEDLKKKINRSPDEADSLMMRMRFEIQPKKRFVYASL